MDKLLRNRLLLLQKLDGWCWPAKADHLARLVISEKPELMVELGVFGGRSIGALAMAAQHIGVGRCIGIDPWSIPAALEGEIGGAHMEWWSKLNLDKIYQDCRSKMGDLGLLSTVDLWREKDTASNQRFVEGSIDLLHSDSNHSPEVSERVTRNWHPKLRVGGILIFDDCAWPTQAKAVEIIKGELNYEILHEETGDKGSYLVARRR